MVLFVVLQLGGTPAARKEKTAQPSLLSIRVYVHYEPVVSRFRFFGVSVPVHVFVALHDSSRDFRSKRSVLGVHDRDSRRPRRGRGGWPWRRSWPFRWRHDPGLSSSFYLPIQNPYLNRCCVVLCASIRRWCWSGGSSPHPNHRHWRVRQKARNLAGNMLEKYRGLRHTSFFPDP